jgi:hypothetical protein
MTSMLAAHPELASNNVTAISEPWTWRDTLRFTVVGAVLFGVMFAFMFSLGNMQ